ncbi:MAG: hypothetical protein IPM53_21670 [Anaerolineaceae bacterium]|nr:hypothetical protein [Anaerolineaceae bacterium]
MLDISHKPDLGYFFYPSQIHHYPGHPQLDVILTEKPTERHFDPTKVQFQIVASQARAEHLTVRHPWTAGEKYRVSAGRIFIVDRIDKKVEAFSFGGELRISADQKRTLCSLTSPAPIFDLCTTHSLPMWLTAEVEILWAEQKAHWQSHTHDSFEVQLGKIDPMVLYVSCLQTLHNKNWPVHEDEYGVGPHFVRDEIKRLKEAGAWPPMIPSLPELLSKSWSRML